MTLYNTQRISSYHRVIDRFDPHSRGKLDFVSFNTCIANHNILSSPTFPKLLDLCLFTLLRCVGFSMLPQQLFTHMGLKPSESSMILLSSSLARLHLQIRMYTYDFNLPTLYYPCVHRLSTKTRYRYVTYVPSQTPFGSMKLFIETHLQVHVSGKTFSSSRCMCYHAVTIISMFPLSLPTFADIVRLCMSLLQSTSSFLQRPDIIASEHYCLLEQGVHFVYNRMQRQHQLYDSSLIHIDGIYSTLNTIAANVISLFTKFNRPREFMQHFINTSGLCQCYNKRSGCIRLYDPDFVHQHATEFPSSLANDHMFCHVSEYHHYLDYDDAIGLDYVYCSCK